MLQSAAAYIVAAMIKNVTPLQQHQLMTMTVLGQKAQSNA